MREAGGQVLARLGGDPRLSRERAVLETVLAAGSVRAAVQALGRSDPEVPVEDGTITGFFAWSGTMNTHAWLSSTTPEC